MNITEGRTETLEQYMRREFSDGNKQEGVFTRANGSVLENFQLLFDNTSSEKVGDVIVAYFQEEGYERTDESGTEFIFEKEEERLKVCLFLSDDAVISVSLTKIQ